MNISRREFNQALAGISLSTAVPIQSSQKSVQFWLSTVNRSHRLTRSQDLFFHPTDTSRNVSNATTLRIAPDVRYQNIFGLGSSLEASTCWNLSKLSPEARKHWLSRLVSPSQGIGMNLMRVCIGTSDFTGDPWYSYADLPKGETDPELKSFSIERDNAYILPILRLAKELNPNLLFFASPWSPPGWMKSSGSMIGGTLLPKWYPVYAEYFVRFIQAYSKAGIPIHAVTIQNEPGVDREKEKDPKWYYPSCHWTAEQERDFVRDHLGPAFRRNKLPTKIWCYDHNYNEKATPDDAGIDYPLTILRDPAAASYVDGVAFHGYVGQPTGMTTLHKQFPQFPIHFTEGSVFGINGARDLIDRLRNYASSYNAWVTMLDTAGKPNNGPFEASRTILSLDSKTLEVSENFDFDMYGHFMKFIARGARRIESTDTGSTISNVVFQNPNGKIVVIVANTGKQEGAVNLLLGKSNLTFTLAGEAIATLLI